jgi:hypothetical protein
MGLVTERLLFSNGFPSLVTRAVWNCQCLIDGCDSIEQSTGTHAKGRYQQLSQRMRCDAKYVNQLSKLVSIYMFKVNVIKSFQARCATTNHTRQSQDHSHDICYAGL